MADASSSAVNRANGTAFNAGTAAPSSGSAGTMAFVPRNAQTGSADYSGTSTPGLGVPLDTSTPKPAMPTPGLTDPKNDTNAPGVQGNPAIPKQVQNNANTGVGASSLNPTIPAPVATPETGGAAPTKYQTGLATAQASGKPAPSDAGAARAAVSAYTPPDQPDTSQVDTMLSSDPVIDKLMKGITQLMNPQQQASTLMEDYSKLYKQSGLGEINKEIIDANTVINGTEGDIRNEIQTAGGLGTDSQVQAMSLSRNKALLTRYNQLTQMKTDATNQLNTMMQLNQQDKQMAQSKMDNQISQMFNLANFRQQAQKNVQEGFNSLVAKVGYAGAYQAYSQDPQQLAAIEKTMGLESGGLKKLAAQPDLDRMEKEANIAQSKASTAASYSTIAKNNADMAATQTAKSAAVNSGVGTADTVLGKIKEAMGKVSPFSSGLLGGYSTLIPGSPSKNLETTIDTIKSNLAFSQLSALRAASPTGGALGAISDSEERLLASTVASLDVGQSPKQLQQNLGLVQQHYVSYLNSLGYDYDEQTGTIISP